jgi:dihydropteroate synthase
MGILNVTPDSFSDGGLFIATDDAVAHGVALFEAGADIIDVGGESTRPGAAPVDAATQIARVVPVIRTLFATVGAPISIDTTSGEVARAALDAGAHIVNDISAGRGDESMFQTVAERDAGIVLMHMQGTPRTMQENPAYGDVVEEVGAFLRTRADRAVAAGVRPDRIAVDPGIGFGKTAAQNVTLLASLDRLATLGYPILVGTSRKSFLGALTGREVAARGAATDATVALALWLGAAIVRVHDVEAARDIAAVVRAYKESIS